MKKTLLILCALLLTAVGASAQTAYEFTPTNWVVPSDRPLTTAENNSDGTITVTAGGNNGSYTNDIALGNMSVMGTSGSNTANYYITSEQKYFVVIGSDLSTTLSDSYLWWMNGTLRTGFDASGTITLNEGQTLVYWNLSSELTSTGNITLSGGTCFGLTSTDETSHKSTISYIGFYTQDQIDALITGKPYEFKNTDWVGVNERSANEGQVTYSEDESNTITVTSTGANNIALENKSENGGYVTADYYVTAEQHWFVIKGTDLSTQDGDSYIWFMNGVNQGTNVAPSETITLEDGSVMLAWDLTKTGLDGSMTSERNYLTGYICFGLTSTDQTTGKSTISDIGFYTEAEVEANLTITPYEFNAKDWAATYDHSSTGATSVVYDEEGNTITVTATGDTNVALSNSPTANDGDPTIGITTGLYTITNEQIYFVVIGTYLSTDISKSKLWWMNHANIGGNVDPTITTLSDGRIVFAWDLSNTTAFPDATNLFDGWTCFALTSTAADNKSTIYDINFYTEDELTAIIEGDAHFCIANESHWTSSDGAAFWVDTAVKEDGSGMEPPFLTYWTSEADGGTLSDATFTHETLTLEPGLYEVSMQIRVIDYDEGKTVGEGTLFSAATGSTTVSQDIELGVDANETSFYENGDHDDVYGTYTLYVTVAEGESLTVSLTVKDATYNWIMWKNLTVRLLGEDETIPSGTVSGTMGAEYGTLILPFDATITDGLTAYTAGEVTTTDGESVLTLTDAGTSLKAGTPYIIGGTSGNETYSFSGVPTKYEVSYTDGLLTGTLVDMSLANGDFTQDGTQYVLQNHTGEGEDGLAFYPITTSSTGVELNAYHCYLTYSNSSGVKGFICFPNSDGEATAIEAVEGAEAEANGAIYDLSGRKVSKAVKGVYIQNGKKVLVK